MNFRQITAVWICILFVSCTGTNPKQTNEEVVNETPEIIEDLGNKSSYTRFSGKYYDNIIEELYKEALDKNEKLSILDNEINNVCLDSLNLKTEDYLKFKDINNDYWLTAEKYVYNLSDSVLQESMFDIVIRMRSNYENKVAKHNTKLKDIELLQNQLDDQLVILKLYISQSMITNYQNNEMPDIESLESLIKDYESLLEEMREFTEIKK